MNGTEQNKTGQDGTGQIQTEWIEWAEYLIHIEHIEKKRIDRTGVDRIEQIIKRIDSTDRIEQNRYEQI